MNYHLNHRFKEMLYQLPVGENCNHGMAPVAVAGKQDPDLQFRIRPSITIPGKLILFVIGLMMAAVGSTHAQKTSFRSTTQLRERISINQGWKFYRYGPTEKADSLIYDVRPEIEAKRDDGPADAKPTEAVMVAAAKTALKPWILPTGNDFIADTTKRYKRPEGHPGIGFPFTRGDFNDGGWDNIDLPHDWAIKGPFYKGEGVPVGGGMGRLPIQGVAWYRRTIDIQAADKGKNIFLEVDGAMSYAMVWLNGNLVGGWPYGYSSWRVDLTPYIIPGGKNQLAIRVDNPLNSSRWYPGGGIYRNVWLTKTNPVNVGQWGTFITTGNISKQAAKVDIKVNVTNHSGKAGNFIVSTEIYQLDKNGHKVGQSVASTGPLKILIMANANGIIPGSVQINHPKLWGPLPAQTPNRYAALTRVSLNGISLDIIETAFGIRELRFDPEKGIFINGQRVVVNGVNQHHDLGALGAAFNERAAERQLEMLREMGCNAIRMSHNPPAPELLDLTDRMGF
ncbi:MAG: sugar-binding domain-containing protein, partial [Ferruginibacter sp.]